MATNLQIDDELIVKAVKLGRHKSKKAAVTEGSTEGIYRAFGTGKDTFSVRDDRLRCPI